MLFRPPACLALAASPVQFRSSDEGPAGPDEGAGCDGGLSGSSSTQSPHPQPELRTGRREGGL